MQTLALVLVLAVLMSFLLPATATAQGKEDLKAVRANNSPPFYMGYITGLTNGYIAANLVTCPRPVNGVMVLGVLDSNSHPYDDRTPELLSFARLSIWVARRSRLHRTTFECDNKRREYEVVFGVFQTVLAARTSCSDQPSSNTPASCKIQSGVPRCGVQTVALRVVGR